MSPLSIVICSIVRIVAIIIIFFNSSCKTKTRDIPNIQAEQTIEGVFTIEDIFSNENRGFSLKEYYKYIHVALDIFKVIKLLLSNDKA